MLYDPKYGVCDTIKDFTPEYRDVVEDMICTWDRDVPQSRKAVAKAGW